MGKLKMKRSYKMYCQFRSNVDDVQINGALQFYIMRILIHKIFYRKLKIHSMSIKNGNVEYSMVQK